MRDNIFILITIAIIGIFGFVIIPNLLPSLETVRLRQTELRKVQIISVDEKGNELWRVYDEDIGRYIYYMPKGEASWNEPSGKSSTPMEVR